MSEILPSVTVLIPARPEQKEIKAVTAGLRLDYPADKLELLVARGKQPSVQRNTGLREARGELVYFLDDDSVPQSENLKRALEHLRKKEVEIVGGPNVCPPDAPWLEQVFALVLSSWIAFGPSRARYTPVGEARRASEKELILCNLVARRETILKYGGFNEALYPNEENALMDQIQHGGGILIYDPLLVVQRRPRANLKAFTRMLRTYGRGRSEQFRVHPTFGSALNFVPPLFCLYLLGLVVLAPFMGQHHKLTMLLWPLAVYVAALLGQAVFLLGRGGLLKSLAAIPLLLLSHTLYGLGFWRGLFTRLKAGQTAGAGSVALERLTK